MYLCVVYSLIHLSIHSFKVLWDKENEDSITLTLWEGNFRQRGKIFTWIHTALKSAAEIHVWQHISLGTIPEPRHGKEEGRTSWAMT